MDFPEESSYFIWSVEAAAQRSLGQIGASACGATALVNGLSALGLSVPPAAANEAVGTRLRKPGAGIVDYLRSRSNAGATHLDIIKGCKLLVGDEVDASFCSYEQINTESPSFIPWCLDRMKAGKVLILTMNLQLEVQTHAVEWIPDAWHHQMVFGVNAEQGLLYLTNPICAMTEAELHRVLFSDSVLKIRDVDVVLQTEPGTGVDRLAEQLREISPDWSSLRVAENYLELMSSEISSLQHRYLSIPAAYTTGVTVLNRVPAFRRLLQRADSVPTELHYTTHHNWEWVVEEAVKRAAVGLNIYIKRQEGSREMPSRKLSTVQKSQYALFRVELINPLAAQSILGAWATSTVLEFLDPKDALYKSLVECGCSDVMPLTLMLPWDCGSIRREKETVVTDSGLIIPELLVPSESRNVLLKASLGSGGYGLYFVESVSDVEKVIKNHAERALAAVDFVSNLRRDYGEVPSWSLQSLVPSIRTKENRKCQFRSYVVVCNKSLYIYETIEARIVCWDPSLSDEVLRDDEMAFCKDSNARPYNHGRVKKRTERVLIDEISELKAGETALMKVMWAAFLSLRPLIERRMTQSSPGSESGRPCGEESILPCKMAIAGVDLLLDLDYNAYIVEVNNNPAMPGATKSMSSRYKRHLVELISDIITLGLTSGKIDQTKFSKVW